MSSLHADNPSLIPDSPAVAPTAAAETVIDAGATSVIEQPPNSTSNLETYQRRLSHDSLLLVWFDRWILADKSSSWLASALLHITAVLLLSLTIFRHSDRPPQAWLDGAVQSDNLAALDAELNQLASEEGEVSLANNPASSLPKSTWLANSMLVDPDRIELPTTSSPASFPIDSTESIDQPLASRGGGMDGRSLENRHSLALNGGGTAESEAAVELGLKWLAAHQFDDGGWRFDLSSCPQCAGACRNSGFIQSTTGSTGLALLCFLGAGYTQHEGPYQEVIAKGLYFLIDKMLLTSLGGDLRDRSVIADRNAGITLILKSGDMYSHAIATLTLCESYAMSRDESLAQPAQEAIDFIVNAQHEKGGWRYEPGEPGDTSVTGWQLTALKSGLLAKLHIPRHVWYRAAEYLDSVQEERGATYGYQEPSTKRRSMSAVGLLSRMMLGWPRNHPPMLKGMARLADQPPEQNHIYFNYYAAQALHHFGGKGWLRWNERMRQYLVESQSNGGHERGSWYFQESWSDRGGRLYTTTMAILTLEVYYRYMPMYREEFVGEGP